ncbi:hypothetical protein DCAR_0415968 [Daucus carota subsp. sativus]|uniref:GRF-type domain-containing protein n=1 Tax=Daucus carota subsp. sativus TaxID=79200 RepID=A0AAF1AXF8_DAUCS|nr:hypothetical protein DCAR_0415968 [Daucus carota subsp. sativus]
MNQQCSCGNWAVEKTSWTEYNPGRRFLTCVNGRCNFFRWNEPEFDARSKSLTETQNEAAIYKEKMSELKKEARQWKFVCVLLLLYVFHYWFAPVGRDETNV